MTSKRQEILIIDRSNKIGECITNMWLLSPICSLKTFSRSTTSITKSSQSQNTTRCFPLPPPNNQNKKDEWLKICIVKTNSIYIRGSYHTESQQLILPVLHFRFFHLILRLHFPIILTFHSESFPINFKNFFFLISFYLHLFYILISP